jgi:CRP-like cAMP-binding protein
MVGSASDFNPIVDKHPELQRFFWRLIQRNEAIGYEWLVNCGRRDSTARVAHLLCETAIRSGVDAPRSGADGQSVHPAADRRHHRARPRST